MISLFTSSFKIALGSLLVSKVRSFLTILGVVIGVASVIILVSLGSGLQVMISQQFMNMGANLIMVMPGKIDLASGDFSSLGSMVNSKLNQEDVKLVRSVADVKVAVPFTVGYLPISYQGKSLVVEVAATDDKYVDILNWTLEDGRNFTTAELNSGKKVVVVGYKSKDKVFGDKVVGESASLGGDRYRVVGLLSKKGGSGQMDWDKHVFVPMSVAKRLLGNDNVQVIYFQFKDGVNADSGIREVKNSLLHRHKEDEFSILQSGDLLKSFESILGAVTLALAGIAAISLFVGGIGIMNIMLVSVTERTREIGLRKAVGASFSDILWQFLIEAIVVSSLGGALGIALGFGGSFILGKFLSTSVPLWSVVVAFSFSVFVGVAFGIAPAYKAAKLDPIEALRYE